jgi:26S proteasome regulatory subunit N2
MAILSRLSVLQSKRLDVFEKAIVELDNTPSMLDYAYKIIMSLVENRHYRNELLKILVKLYKSFAIPDYVNICQCLIFLDDAQSVAAILDNLVRSKDYEFLMAYQMSFDLYESATQQFLSNVMDAIEVTAPISNLLPRVKRHKEDSSTTAEKDDKMINFTTY